MIKTKISEQFPHHADTRQFQTSVYIADRTIANKGIQEIITSSDQIPEAFLLGNSTSLDILVNVHNKNSFTEGEDSLSQCECAAYQNAATETSWFLLLELKYCHDENKTRSSNLPKAKKQLLATHGYYKEKGIISKKNTSYLIAGFPKITVPFRNKILTPKVVSELKRDENIVIRIANSCQIVDKNKIEF